jgi:Subtilase family
MSKTYQPSVSKPLYNELALRAMGVGTKGVEGPQSTDKPGRVVIGFVDYGFDLLHPCLLDPSGTQSRFKYLWDQNRTPEMVRQEQFPLAAVYDYSADVINQLIAVAQQCGDRSVLDSIYDPHANYYGRSGVGEGAHGTLMASMAAGTRSNGFHSPAPFADLIGVQLAVADTDWREETATGQPTWRDAATSEWAGWRTYDACPQIVHAIHYIYDRASRLGAELVIINLSIGTWAGAHDGQSPVEQAIAKVISYGRRQGATACQVVVGAGNAGADQGHFSAALAAGDTTTFQWLMNADDPSQNKLEIWYDGPPLQIELTGPAQEARRQTISTGQTQAIELDATRVGIADHVIAARGSLSRVRILLHPSYMAGSVSGGAQQLTWSLIVRSTEPSRADAASNSSNTLHAWVERDDGLAERSWLVPHHRSSTLCCLATAPDAIIVGGGNHHTTDPTRHAPLDTMPFSGRGPAPWGDNYSTESAFGTPQHPVMAPGYNIWGAQSKTAGFVQTSGTSAAAALMSGALAAQYCQLGKRGTDRHDNISKAEADVLATTDC